MVRNNIPLDQNLVTLANVFKLTGAQIKYAVLAGLFAAKRDAKPLGMRHLLRGVERELIKEGRALSERERKRLNEYGGRNGED